MRGIGVSEIRPHSRNSIPDFAKERSAKVVFDENIRFDSLVVRRICS